MQLGWDAGIGQSNGVGDVLIAEQVEVRRVATSPTGGASWSTAAARTGPSSVSTSGSISKVTVNLPISRRWTATVRQLLNRDES
jgi:hypothetical protein